MPFTNLRNFFGWNFFIRLNAGHAAILHVLTHDDYVSLYLNSARVCEDKYREQHGRRVRPRSDSIRLLFSESLLVAMSLRAILEHERFFTYVKCVLSYEFGHDLA